MKLGLTLNDVKIIAEELKLRTGLDYEWCMNVIIELLGDEELPINMNEMLRECIERYKNPLSCHMVVGSLLGYILSFCDKTNHCNVVVEEKPRPKPRVVQ